MDKPVRLVSDEEKQELTRFAEKAALPPGGRARDVVSAVLFPEAEPLRRTDVPPGLELVYDRFARSLRPVLTRYMNNNCSVSLAGSYPIKFAAFVKKLPHPAHLHLFRLPPLFGHALLHLQAPFVFSATDCLLGGTGRPLSRNLTGREFSAVENRLMAKLVLELLGCLKEAWDPVLQLDPVYARSESNPLSLNTSCADELCFLADFRVEFSKQSGSFSLCTPHSVFEPVKDKLRSAAAGKTRGELRQLARTIRKAEATVSARVGEGRIKVRDLLSLKPGQVIFLGGGDGINADVLVEGAAKFRAIISNQAGKKVLKISGTIKES